MHVNVWMEDMIILYWFSGIVIGKRSGRSGDSGIVTLYYTEYL